MSTGSAEGVSVRIQPGDLVKFDNINGHTTHLNRKVAVYLGECHIHRDDGVVIRNFKVQILGESTWTVCDEGLRRWLTVITT
jgi:hypothetical protein